MAYFFVESLTIHTVDVQQIARQCRFDEYAFLGVEQPKSELPLPNLCYQFLCVKSTVRGVKG